MITNNKRMNQRTTYLLNQSTFLKINQLVVVGT